MGHIYPLQRIVPSKQTTVPFKTQRDRSCQWISSPNDGIFSSTFVFSWVQVLVKRPYETLVNKFDYWHVLVAILLAISIVCYQSYVIPTGHHFFFSRCYFIRKPQGSQHRPFWLARISCASCRGNWVKRPFTSRRTEAQKKRSYGQKRLGWFLLIVLDVMKCPALCFIANDAIALLTPFLRSLYCRTD